MTSESMTYPVGTWVYHVPTRRVGRLVDDRDKANLCLRPPCGGYEWKALPSELRVATTAQRVEAGVRGAGTSQAFQPDGDSGRGASAAPLSFPGDFH